MEHQGLACASLDDAHRGGDELDAVVIGLVGADIGVAPLLLCFFTGDPPPCCAPMRRDPEPEVGMALDESFPRVLEKALRVNWAIHDGAIMLGRARREDPYLIHGWSFRLFPPPGSAQDEPNRGSAFNSCLAMSSQIGVDRLYVFSIADVTRFVSGRAKRLGSVLNHLVRRAEG